MELLLHGKHLVFLILQEWISANPVQFMCDGDGPLAQYQDLALSLPKGRCKPAEKEDFAPDLPLVCVAVSPCRPREPPVRTALIDMLGARWYLM